MRYQTLFKRLVEFGYQFKAKYGQYQVTNTARPLLKITHCYPEKKKGRIQTSTGYITRVSLSGQLPEDTYLYWCTSRIEREDNSVIYSGSDWSHLRHIVTCSLVPKTSQRKKNKGN